MSEKWYRIGQAAEYLGVSDSTLRLWDVERTFQPERVLPSGWRLYSQEQLDAFVAKMQDACGGE